MIVERTENPQWLSNAYLVADKERGTGVLIDGNEDIDPLIDIAEREAEELAAATRRGAGRGGIALLPGRMSSRLGVKPELLPPILRRLGVRVIPAEGLAPDQFGPPAPAMITRSPRPSASPP